MRKIVAKYRDKQELKQVEWFEIPQDWTEGGLTKYLNPVVDYRGKTPEKSR